MEKVSTRNIAYRIDQPNNSMGTFVILHALALNYSIVEDMATYLGNRGYGIIAVELRGHGCSDQNGCSMDCYLDESVEDVLDILESENISGHIYMIGHSLGAVVAVSFVDTYPLFDSQTRTGSSVGEKSVTGPGFASPVFTAFYSCHDVVVVYPFTHV
jgi:alpha-beta hydrolase superfamily lysophospholipase